MNFIDGLFCALYIQAREREKIVLYAFPQDVGTREKCVDYTRKRLFNAEAATKFYTVNGTNAEAMFKVLFKLKDENEIEENIIYNFILALEREIMNFPNNNVKQAISDAKNKLI